VVVKMRKHKEIQMNTNGNRMRKRDLERLDLAIGNWRLTGQRTADRDDKELARQYAADVEDLTAFRDAVARGDLEAARRLADAMDTIVRDQIPVRLYHNIFPER